MAVTWVWVTCGARMPSLELLPELVFTSSVASGVRVFIPMVCAEKLYYRWVEQKKEVFFHRIELFWSLMHVDLLFLRTQKYQNTLFPTFFVLFFA